MGRISVPGTAMQCDDQWPQRRLAALFVAAGGLALCVQVVLLRELLVALQGDETAVALGLAFWLAGIAAGASVARRPAASRPAFWASLGFALLAASGPLEVLAARLGRWLLAPPPGELLPIGSAALLALATLAFPGCLVGWTFTALASTARRAGWRRGEGIARLYVFESLGSLLGGLGVTFLVIPFLAPLAGILLTSSFWVLVGLPSTWRRLVPGRALLIALSAVLAGVALSPISGLLSEASVHLRFRGLAPGIPLLDWTDTPYQHLAVASDSLQHLYAGGQYVGSFPDPAEHEALAHRLACLAAHPASALVVGGGTHGTLRFLLRHPFERVDLVEIDRRGLDFVRRFLPREDREALADPRVRIITDDPRRFLARGDERYDFILVLEPAPVTLLLARLSTVEFYRLCASHLAADGVVVVRLETAPNVITGETAAVGGSLYGALRAVFPVVRAGPGPDGLLLAGTDPDAVSLDPAVLAQRFRDRGIPSQVFVPELFALLFPAERVAAQQEALKEASTRFPPSRDQRPVSFLHALALRQQLAGSRLASLFTRVARASPAPLAALTLLPSLLVLGRLRWKRPGSLALAAMHAVAVTGGCGMAWSLLILFSFQTRAGALYGQIGWLSAVFMLGLALGGAALSRRADQLSPLSSRWLAMVTGTALAFALLMPGALRALGMQALDHAALPALLHGALLLGAGAVTGGLFPVAAGVLLAADRGVRATASGLEAADHAGAALAALVGGVILIPALGLTGTAWLLAALEGTALAGVGLAAVRGREIG